MPPLPDNNEGKRGHRPMRMPEKLIPNLSARLMIPFILLFGLYVQFHGDFGPGGGFQAGVIFAAGLILYALVFGLRALTQAVPPRVLERLMAAGALLYGGTGVVAMLGGGTYLDYDALPFGLGQHWGIFIIELGVGITVASSISLLFLLFAGAARRVEGGGDGGRGAAR